MEDVNELLRLPAPALRPQAMAFDGTRLWIGSLVTRRLYSIDPATWTARDEGEVPGKPWGMTPVGDEFRVICGDDDDNRVVRRFVPGHGFKMNEGMFRAPGDTGSHLAYDGERLYLSQWYDKRILALDASGAVTRVIPLPHEVVGQVIVEGRFYLATTDDETSDDYFLTRVDARGETLVLEDLARIPFAARGLAFDGTNFWTNHREAAQTVSFARPDA